MPEYLFGALKFDPREGRLSHQSSGKSVTLRPQVGKLLQAFVQQPGVLIDREALIQAVWGNDTVVDFESGLAAILRELRSEIETLDEPPTLIETVPRRGYRLCAEVRTPNRMYRRQLGVAAGIAVVVLIAVLGYSLQSQNTAEQRVGQTQPDARSLALIPFEQFGDADSQSLQILLADRLLMALWDRRPDDMILVGRAWTGAADGRSENQSAIAGQLAVDLLVEGTVTVEGHQITVTARLLEMPESIVLWAETSTAKDDNVLASLDAIAARLAESLVAGWASNY